MAWVYDFWPGVKDNFAADWAMAEQVAAAYPDMRAAVRAQRAFLAQAMHFLVTEAGIRQLLDIGTGLPSANNTHQVAQKATWKGESGWAWPPLGSRSGQHADSLKAALGTVASASCCSVPFWRVER
jgi:hypothetical protein